MNKTTVYYMPEGDDVLFDCQVQWTVDWHHPPDLELAALEAAERFYEDAGGDLADPTLWPIRFKLFADPEGECCGDFSVDIEYIPTFTADPVEARDG